MRVFGSELDWNWPHGGVIVSAEDVRLTVPQIALGVTIVGSVIAVTMAFADVKSSTTMLNQGQERIYAEVKEAKMLIQNDADRIESLDRRIERLERAAKGKI